MANYPIIKRFFGLLKLDRKDIGYIYLYAIFSGLITLSLPLGVQAIINMIAGGAMSAALIILVAVVTLGTFLTGVLRIMQISVTESIQRRIFARSSLEFAWRLPRIRIEEFSDEYPPELVNRFFDTITLQKGMPKLLTDISTAVLQILFGLLLISLYHPTFVAFSVVLLFVLVLLLYFSGPRGLSTALLESKYKYKVAYWLEEIARAVTTFKLSGQAVLPLKHTQKLVKGYMDARHAHYRVLLLQYISMVIFMTLITLSLLLLGSMLVINNEITIGQFVAAEIVIILILGSVEKLILSMDTIYDLLTAVEKIGYVTDLDLETEAEGLSYEKIDEVGKGLSIQFRDLNFRFPNSNRDVVKRINLNIKAGERICILGPNSSGKSTFIHLAGMLYTKYTGSITYNGVPAKNIDYQDLRRHIGDYMRDEDIFRASLIENLWLHEANPDIPQIQWAIDYFDLSEFVASLPNGLNTELLPSGRNLPASVRTKLLLIRSLMGAPRLLALGDFGANLSTSDKHLVADLLTNRAYPWTVMAVSHDPYFAERCDRILYFESGKIQLDGTYEEISQDPRVAFILGLSKEDPFHPTKSQ